MPDDLLETPRLVLTKLSYDDCPFILELVNEEAFKRFVGDKKVTTLDEARTYLEQGPIGSYEKHGFGMFLVRNRADEAAMGICGLVQREQFDDPDVGFAFLRRYWAQGYAHEAARAVLDYGRNQLGLQRIIAMADPDNAASLRLIEKLGLRYESMVRMEGDARDVCLYGTTAS